jgi:hypothetical protein
VKVFILTPGQIVSASHIALFLALLLPAPLLSQANREETGVVALQETVIDTVIVDRQDLFPSEEAAENSFYGFFNSLHTTTRPFVIHHELLLRAGMPFDSSLAAESERNLRQRRLFRSVRVDSGRVDGKLALFVHTRDAWSFVPRATGKISPDGRLIGSAGITESNVAGTGTRVRAYYLRAADRDGIDLGARSRRIGKGQLGASFRWLNLSDRDITSWSVSKPFRAMSDRFSIFYDGQAFRGRTLQFRVESPTAADTTVWRRQAAINRVFITYAPIANSREYLRVGVQLEHRREQFIKLNRPELNQDSIIAAVPDSAYGLVGAFMEYRRARFERVRRLNGFPEEDQDLSDLIFVSVNLASKGLGYASTGVGARILLQSGVKTGGLLVKGVIDGNALFNSAGLDSGRVQTIGTAAVQWEKRNSTFVQASGGILDSVRPGQEFDLGFQVMPRLWGPHAFVGTRTWRLTVEHRYYAFDNMLGIMGMGFGAFLDYGGAWYPDERIRPSGVRSSSRVGGNTGLSIIFGSNLGSFAQVAHLSAGYRFGGGIAETKRWAISLGSGIIF